MTQVVPLRTRAHDEATARLRDAVGVADDRALSVSPGHALLAGPCRVHGCRRTGRVGHGLCAAHAEVWVDEGHRDLEEWLPTVAGGPLPCRVDGCNYGRSGRGLCAGHDRRWRQDQGPDLNAWITAASAEGGEHSRCLVRGCRIWASNWDGFCLAHSTRFQLSRGPHSQANLRHLDIRQLKAQRRHEAEAFVQAEQQRNDDCDSVDLSGLQPRLRLEIRYLFQAHLQHGRRRLALSSWALLVHRLDERRVLTLTSAPVASWIATLDLRRHTEAKAILSWGCDQLDRLLTGNGWESEYDRDSWRLSRLGYDGHGHALLRFDQISQPWLRELAKRWTRHRLCTGIAPGGSSLGVRGLTSLSQCLSSLTRSPQGPNELTHEMLQTWVSDLAKDGPAASTRMGLIGQVSVFLREVHRRGWAPDLPSSTMVYPEDFPPRSPRTARGLSEHVMAQLETADALTRLPDRHRLVVEVLMRCGLRSSDGLGLSVDCVVRDSGGHPYLQYLNHKMKRTAFVPIDDDLATQLEEQRRRVLDTFPARPSGLLLFPSPTSNPFGTKRRSSSGLRLVIEQWLSDLRVCDEQGHPVHVTPHQFRHTFGTRLINRDVQQHIVQQLLDHTSPEMTAHYARLNNKTVRNAWAKARLLDVQGNPLPHPNEGDLAAAVWTRRGLEKAKQTLPNGYCGMPLHSPCDHANACLTCPLFITSGEFLPQHRTQLTATLELIDVSKERGHQRLVDANEKVATNLQRIIAACENDANGTEPADAR